MMMMKFESLIMTENGVITAKAVGHPTEVVSSFRDACELLLASRGPWRITRIEGLAADDDHLDSDMSWQLEAKTKSVAL
jgi:hypothetical protein